MVSDCIQRQQYVCENHNVVLGLQIFIFQGNNHPIYPSLGKDSTSSLCSELHHIKTALKMNQTVQVLENKIFKLEQYVEKEVYG